MKKIWIDGIYSEGKGIVSESWQGGGISDIVFKKRYDDGYEFVHCCQDVDIDDVYHYIFQKYGSDEPLGYCGMCRTRLTGRCSIEESPAPGSIEIKVPTEIYDAIVRLIDGEFQ